MACSQTLNGLVRDCETNIGGLKAVYFGNFGDIVKKTVSGDKITAFDVVTEDAVMHGFYFKPGQATLNYEPQFNDAGEYAGEQLVLGINFGRQDTTKRVQMNALSKAECSALVLDNNGHYWWLGDKFPIVRTGGSATLGQARTDRNQYALEMTGHEDELPMEVEATAAEGIID